MNEGLLSRVVNRDKEKVAWGMMRFVREFQNALGVS